MDYLPIFLNIREQRCLVVGGGEVATRKATMLMRAGARVQVVAPEIAPALSEKLSKHEGHYRKGGYEIVVHANYPLMWLMRLRFALLFSLR